MILHKLANAIRRQDWFTVLLEVVIVMIGILLGLQLNAWNQSRIDRVDEKVFLQALYQDVLELEDISNRLIARRLKELNALASAADVLYGRAEWRELTERECNALSTSHSPGIVATSLPSWTALRDAGRTNIISNAELKRSLATLTQKRESLDRIMAVAEYSGERIRSSHPELFTITPLRTELIDAPSRIYYTTEAKCDTKALSQNKSALNALAGNMNRFSSVINRFGIAPWAEQVSNIRRILETDSAEFKTSPD